MEIIKPKLIIYQRRPSLLCTFIAEKDLELKFLLMQNLRHHHKGNKLIIVTKCNKRIEYEFLQNDIELHLSKEKYLEIKGTYIRTVIKEFESLSSPH